MGALFCRNWYDFFLSASIAEFVDLRLIHVGFLQMGERPESCIRHAERLPVHAAAQHQRKAPGEGAAAVGGQPVVRG